ncbi:hypothetical protein HQO84_22875 [Rhodococcus fascians]|nr:hypothetical protein [Rhodococcus fascians]MBY3998508.1 hypothetical protein [Rhodococcus fascians]MBY4004498.1 hypothetical protein [Rhodococcus fascians]MBY4009321.1 hypothetical protein [Rhodococcus fascians]MBY4019705.1 hypothetical protein [Rhodococcus fascians]
MSSYFLIEQSVRAGKMAELQEIMRKSWPALLNFPGNEGVRIFKDPDCSDRLVLLMRWTNSDDFSKYQTWRNETGTAKLILDRLDHVSIRPLDHIDLIFPKEHEYDDKL